MKIPRRRFLHLAAGAAALPAVSRIAWAQAYPSRPVRIIVPFGAGGPSDVIARLIAGKLTENLGKQFYVENQAGAGGNLGMGDAARAAPDGYTILFVSSSYVVNPSLYPRVPYDPDKDFAPLTVTADAPIALLVHPSLPAKSAKELIDLIKANPGKYSFAHAGIGTTPHLSGEMFKLAAALDLVAVPFNGGGPALQSTVAGHTPIVFNSLAGVVALVKDGRLRALAVAAKTRSAALPDVPTLDEAGFKGQEANMLVDRIESALGIGPHWLQTVELSAPLTGHHAAKKRKRQGKDEARRIVINVAHLPQLEGGSRLNVRRPFAGGRRLDSYVGGTCTRWNGS